MKSANEKYKIISRENQCSKNAQKKMIQIQELNTTEGQTEQRGNNLKTIKTLGKHERFCMVKFYQVTMAGEKGR